MDKDTVAYPLNGILLSSKKESTAAKRNNTDESQMHYAKYKKPDSKGYMLYEPIYRTFLKRHNYKDRKKDQWWPVPKGKDGKS